MKALKVTLAVTFLAASALVVAPAAETLLPPRTATAATRSAVGCPRGLAPSLATTPSAATTNATAHCKTPKKGQPRMSCCN